MSSGAPVEPASPTGASVTATPLCANCGARLGGKYCSACGQRHHELGVLGVAYCIFGPLMLVATFSYTFLML
jgi:hypothetical protein